jgi:hypothetical protein
MKLTLFLSIVISIVNVMNVYSQGNYASNLFIGMSKKYNSNDFPSRLDELVSKIALESSLVFYNTDLEDDFQNSYRKRLDIIADGSGVKELKNGCGMKVNILKEKEDKVYTDYLSFVNIVEVFYESQKASDGIFAKINNITKVNYQVSPMDWSFYLTSNHSIIILYSEGYRHDSNFFNELETKIREFDTIIGSKIIIDDFIISDK